MYLSVPFCFWAGCLSHVFCNRKCLIFQAFVFKFNTKLALHPLSLVVHECILYYLTCILPTDIYDKAVKLNKTLGIQNKTQDKSFQELQKDVDKMMAELRRRMFKNPEKAAADELK